MIEDDEGSFYDAFDSHEAPELAKTETPFANRKDLTSPYKTNPEVKERIESVVSGPKTGAYHEWWKWITRQNTANVIANEVNKLFDRMTIDGNNYAEERNRYFEVYNDILNNG